MSYRIIYHPQIRQDIARLTRWFLEHGGPDTSRQRLMEVRDFIRLLREMPHRGSTRDDLLLGLRSIPVNRKTTVTFIVDDERREIRIYAISHAGQDWVGLVRQRRTFPN